MKKILFIDDEELLSRTFVNFLTKKGYEVFVAKNGRDAIEIASEEDFDLIISDIRMPGLNGVDAVRKIREVLSLSKRKIPKEIFITGFADSEIEKRALELKPAAYIEKPFDVMVLLNAIQKEIS